MFRRKALAEVGYIALETITEDMHTGLRMNARGWTALAISERRVAGQAAPDITTFHTQRLRWGEGNLSIFAHDNPLTMRGLTLMQRLCYLGSMVHWAGGLFKLVIYLSPILMMLTGVAPLSELTWTLGGITLAYLLVSTFGVRALGNGHGSIINGEFFGMVNFWTQIKGTWRALFKRGQQSFVVTSKRGRQSDSVMRFVHPHIALAGLSALALAWGWSRYAYGVSEDLVRPLLPTVWIVLHLLLIWAVVRRAMWPKDLRYSYRHATTIGVQYALPDGSTGCGVTVDLSDRGVGFVSYTPVPQGAKLEVRLIGGGEDVTLRGKVVRAERVAHDGTLNGAGYRVGVELDELTGPNLDAVNRITYHYAVPRLYQEYKRGNRRSPLTALTGLVSRTLFGRRAHPRQVVRVPAVVSTNGTAHETVTEDLTPVSVSVLLPDAPAPGSDVDLTVRTPSGESTGTATVLRTTAQRIGARVYHRTVLMLREPDGPGFAHVQQANSGGALKPALNPDRREPKRVQTLGAKAVGALGAFILVALGALAFPVAHSDEMFMRDVARATGPATPEQVARLDSIYKRALADTYPDTDKLVLLMRALPKANRTDDCDPLIVTLANRDPKNADLRLALAATQDRKRDFAGAEENYQALLGDIRRGRLSYEQRAAVFLAGARNRINAGDVPAAAERFNSYVSLVADEGVRNEFAGVLITAGRHGEVPALYEGADPDYRGRVLLMSALALSRRFDEAEAQGRTILAKDPDDPHAQLLIAELHAHRREYDKARALFERVVARPDVKPEVRVTLARLQLLRGGFAEALEQCEAAITAGGPTEDAARAFVDAAAGLKGLDAKYRGTAARVYERPETARSNDGVYLARLAYVLNSVKMSEPALALSDRAVALLPNDFGVAEQRYALLMDQDKTGDAAALMSRFRTDETNGQKARERVVYAHLRGGNRNAAEEEARALRGAFPNDSTAIRLLADVLSWQGKYGESLALFEVLRAAAPEDVQVRVRIGQVNLWAGNASAALTEFTRVLDKDVKQPTVWPDFVAAAAALPNATRLSAEQAKVLGRVAEQVVVHDSTDPLFLARLGTVFAREGRAADAKPYLDRAAGLPVGTPVQRRELATVFYGAGRPADALKQYAGLTDLTPDDHLLLTDVYAVLKDFPAAERACRSALLALPGDPAERKDAAERKLADVLSWGGKHDEALAAFRRLRTAKPNDTQLLIRTAETMIWSGAPTDALLLVAATLEMDPEREALYPVYVYAAASVKALSPVHLPLLEKVAAKIGAAKWTDGPQLARLALVHHRLGKAETAKGIADRATRTANRTPAETREIALHLGAMGRTAEAAALFEGRPLTTEDRAALAELAAAARDWVNAERQFRAVLAAAPNDPLPAIRLAEVLSLNDRHDDARTTVEGVLKREPTNPVALVAAGDIYLRAKDAVTAAARFETALKVAPNHSQARAGFIDAASAAGLQLTPAQAKLAVSYADALATGQSVDPVSACRLAWVMVQQHEVPRADKLLDRAVAAITKDTPAAVRRELAPMLALRERGRDAVRMLDGLKPEPDDSLLLAKVHASLNEFPAAVAACRAYLVAKPSDEPAEAQLADLLASSGDHDDALALYAKLRAKNPTDAKLQVRTAEALWRVNRRAEAMDLFVKLIGDAQGMPAADAVGARAAFVAAAFELDKFPPDVLEALGRVRPTVLLSGDAVLMGRLAVAYHRAGKPADADALFDRAAGLIKPDDHETRWLFTAALNLVGRRAEAARTKPVGAPGGETARRVALFYAAAGDFRSATAVLDEALIAKPDDRSLARARGDVLSWGREHAASVAQYKKLLEAGPDADLVVRLAEAHLRAGEPAEALALLIPEVKKKPASSKAVRVFVSAAGDAGALAPETVELVLRCFREVSFVAEPDEPVFAARVALALRAAGEAVKSEKLFDRAAKDAPRDPRARRMLAGVLAAAGRTEAAFKLFDGLDPEPADKLQFAYLHAAKKDFAAAETAVRAFVTANPGDPVGERALADILSWGGKHKEALPAFDKLLAARPGDAELALRVAEARLAAGEYEVAAAAFARAIEARLAPPVPGKPPVPPGPLDARARAGFASAVAALKEPSAAHIDLVAKLAKALPAEDTDYLTAGRLAVALNRAKRTDEAAALADRVAKINSKDPAVRRELAGLLVAVGQPRKAVTELDTTEATAEDRLLLAKLQMELGELSAAESTARKLVAEVPANREAVLVLAEVLSAKKAHGDAAKLFDQALKADPTNSAVRTRAAEAHLGAGSYADAADRFLPLLANNPRADLVKNYFAALAAVGDKEKIAPEHKRAALLLGAEPGVKAETDAAHLVNLAWVHHRCEAPKECDALLTAAAALKPTNEAVRRNLSGVMEVRGRFRDALAALEGVQLDDEGRVRVAKLHLDLADTVAAEKELRAVLEKVPAHAKARRQLAEVHSARMKAADLMKDTATAEKEAAKAAEVLEKLASEFPTDTDLAVRTADAQLANKNFEAALARFRALIGADAGSPDLWFGYINAAASCKELPAADGELALKIAERADGGKDRPAEFWSRLGWVLYRAKKQDRAERLVERAIALKPTGADVRRELAGTAAAMGRNRDALALYEGMELNDDDKYRVAELSIAVRDFPRAERLLAGLLRDKPLDLKLRQLNAHLLLWTKKHAEALKEFRALEAEKPGNGEVLNGIALATLWGGDNEAARPLLQARLAADPKQQVLWLPYLDSVKQAPRVTDAIRKSVIDIADRVDELKDPAADLLGGVGVGLAKVGERDRAIDTLKKAVKANPKSKELLLKLADTLSAAKRYAEADELYKQLITLDAVGSLQK